jgi:Ca2+-binding EF-hand superfamily protein
LGEIFASDPLPEAIELFAILYLYRHFGVAGVFNHYSGFPSRSFGPPKCNLRYAVDKTCVFEYNGRPAYAASRYRLPEVRRMVNPLRTMLVALCLVAVLDHAATAQPPWMRGGDSSSSRGSSGFNPDEMISRMDTNRNGQIEPDEFQNSRARYFLERSLREAGVDTSRAMSVSKIKEVMARRSSSRSSSDSSDRDRDRDRDRDSDRDRDRDRQPADIATPWLVPGFGIEDEITPPPGFGEFADVPTLEDLNKKYDRDVVRRVEESLSRYDKNKNGILEYEEWKDGRWSPSPAEHDKNKDGKLTRKELAERYLSKEKADQEERARRESSRDSGRDSRDSNRDSRDSGRDSGGSSPWSRGSFASGGPSGGFSWGSRDGNSGGPSWGSRDGSGSSGWGSRSGSSSRDGNSSSWGSRDGGGPSFGSRDGGGSSSWGSRDGDRSRDGGSSSSSGSSGSDRMAMFAESMIRQYDKNKDGKLTQDEWGSMRGDPKATDKNGDGVITKEEMVERFTSFSRSRSGDSRSGDSRSGSSSTSSTSSTANNDRKSYRFLTPVERLPKEMPSWFSTSDTNGDGQVAMAEFTSHWSESKVAEFARYDTNGDGYITVAECLKAEGKSNGSSSVASSR